MPVLPELPVLPEPVSPETRQLARCQVPSPVLPAVWPALITSVPSVPTRTFTGGPGRFDTPGAGVQFTAPRTAAAPDAMEIEICSWTPIAVSLWFTSGSDEAIFKFTNTEPSPFRVMANAGGAADPGQGEGERRADARQPERAARENTRTRAGPPCPRPEHSVRGASSPGAGSRVRGWLLAGQVGGGAGAQRFAEALQIGVEIEDAS